MATVALLNRDRLERPAVAVVLIVTALALTAAATLALRESQLTLLRPAVVATELAIGAALVLADGWAYAPGHAFSAEQSLGSVWPLVGVLTAGVALGPVAGASAGAVLALARVGSVLANGASDWRSEHVLSLVNTGVFYALAGATAGYLYRLLRTAEREVSMVRAREEMARTLHDGVLQTLALVERRAGDEALAKLARDQERELREYLFGTTPRPRGAADLGAAVLRLGSRYEEVFGGRVQVLVPDDLPALPATKVEALAGAIGEALTNAGKHGGARHITVYAEPGDGEVFCSVKDDGSGFDPASTTEGVGLRSSIRGRITELGGRVEVASSPQGSTEVRLWLPSA